MRTLSSLCLKGVCGSIADTRLRYLGQQLHHMLIHMVGLNQGRLSGGGDTNRASCFGFQVILVSQGLLAFLVVSLKVRTKGDQRPSPLPQARTLIHSSFHPAHP